MKIFIATFLLFACSGLALASESYESPRLANGNPDFNGVWQVLNRANDNLEPHGAQAAMAFREGPVVPVPAKEVVALGGFCQVNLFSLEKWELRANNSDEWGSKWDLMTCSWSCGPHLCSASP